MNTELVVAEAPAGRSMPGAAGAGRRAPRAGVLRRRQPARPRSGGPVMRRMRARRETELNPRFFLAVHEEGSGGARRFSSDRIFQAPPTSCREG
jgi:hypothetical protein